MQARTARPRCQPSAEDDAPRAFGEEDLEIDAALANVDELLPALANLERPRLHGDASAHVLVVRGATYGCVAFDIAKRIARELGPSRSKHEAVAS